MKGNLAKLIASVVAIVYIVIKAIDSIFHEQDEIE